MKKWIVLLLVFTIYTLSSCANSSEDVQLDPYGYQSGTDMQFFQYSSLSKLTKIQEFKNGCYVYHDGFVYTLDITAQTILPVCSKVNCLHDKEKDPERRKACHAFVSDNKDIHEVSLMLYQDRIFIFIDVLADEESAFGQGASIIEMAADGSSREVIWKVSGASISFPIQHRGYIYYARNTYTVTDDNVSAGLTYQRLNINERNPKPETIYELSKDRKGEGYDMIWAYGKYVYFYCGYTDAEGFHDPCFTYDTETQQLIEDPDIQEDHCCYQGKIYYHPFVGNDYSEVDVFCIDIKNPSLKPERVISGIQQGFNIVSDERYLYLENSIMVTFGNEEVKYFWAYDNDMNLVDFFTVPDTFTDSLMPPIGGKDYQYQIFDDPESGAWGIYVFDKSKIGTLHGMPYPQERIVYGDT